MRFTSSVYRAAVPVTGAVEGTKLNNIKLIRTVSDGYMSSRSIYVKIQTLITSSIFLPVSV